jgi:hypothetical protein
VTRIDVAELGWIEQLDHAADGVAHLSKPREFPWG